MHIVPRLAPYRLLRALHVDRQNQCGEIHEAISWLRVVDMKKGTYFISGTNIERTWIT